MKHLRLLAIACLLLQGSRALALTVEAEQAALRTTGGAEGVGWNLWSDGQLGDYVRTPAGGTHELTVRAGGSSAGGIWPLMTLNVDGVHLQSVSVAASGYADYTFQLELSPHTHSICVAFTNDALVGSEDRNLYIDRLTLAPPAGGAEPVLAGAAAYAADGPERENAVLRASGAAIRQHRMGPAMLTVVDSRGRGLAQTSVTVEQTGHEFLFGSNPYRWRTLSSAAANAAYESRFAALFNYATLPLYWKWLEPQQGNRDFARLDAMAAWCRAQGMRLKGHPLLWDDPNSGWPDWMTGRPDEAAQKAHVEELMIHYAGQVDFWEVVNEPFHYPGFPFDNPNRWARAVTPGGNLIMNDYSVMDDGLPGFFQLLRGGIQRGVPFDTIGIQAHDPDDNAFPLDRVKAVLDHYATLGKELHVTEFLPAANGRPVLGATWRGTWTEAQQADYAEQFYRVCFAHPAVRAITWWEFCDTPSGMWRPASGLLRADLSPRPVYDRLKSLINQEWRTTLAGQADGDGRLSFSGFFGDYRVTATSGTLTRTADFRLRRGAPNAFTLILSDRDVLAPAFAAGGPIPVIHNGTASPAQGGFAEAQLWVRKDAGEWADSGLRGDSPSGSFAFFPQAGEGTYGFAVRLKDGVGGLSALPAGAAPASTLVDTTPPRPGGLRGAQ